MLEIRPLAESELHVLDVLPLSRYGRSNGEYLIAWWDGEPVGHVHVDWSAEPPELQDVWVRDDARRRGIAGALTEAAAQRAVARGKTRLSLEVGEANAGAQALYQRQGFVRTSDPPRHVLGTIHIRSGSIEVDEMLLRYEKKL